jgi:hypothetical protein
MTNKPDSDFMYNWIREKSGKNIKMENKQLSIWTCQYCGKDTSNVDYDYLVGTDHLGCALKAESEMTANEYETCILCGEKTDVKISTHVDFRTGYIEGAGQLCIKCYNQGSNRNHMTIPEWMVENTPNDQELGAKVRELYWENKR